MAADLAVIFALATSAAALSFLLANMAFTR